MKTIVATAIASVLAAGCAHANASGRAHDRALEAAAAKAFAERAGAIRGTFGADEKPVLVTEYALSATPQPLGAGNSPAHAGLSILLTSGN